MKESTGIEIALEALGEALKKSDSDLYIAEKRAESLGEQISGLREQVAMLEEALLAADKERMAANERERVLQARIDAIIEKYQPKQPQLELRGGAEEC